jgi:hypothetical protein
VFDIERVPWVIYVEGGQRNGERESGSTRVNGSLLYRDLECQDRLIMSLTKNIMPQLDQEDDNDEGDYDAYVDSLEAFIAGG